MRMDEWGRGDNWKHLTPGISPPLSRCGTMASPQHSSLPHNLHPSPSRSMARDAAAPADTGKHQALPQIPTGAGAGSCRVRIVEERRGTGIWGFFLLFQFQQREHKNARFLAKCFF